MNGQNLGLLFMFLPQSNTTLHVFNLCNITVHSLPSVFLVQVLIPCNLDYYNHLLIFNMKIQQITTTYSKHLLTLAIPRNGHKEYDRKNRVTGKSFSSVHFVEHTAKAIFMQTQHEPHAPPSEERGHISTHRALSMPNSNWTLIVFSLHATRVPKA